MSGAQRRGPEIDGGLANLIQPCCHSRNQGEHQKELEYFLFTLRFIYCFLSTKSKKGSLHWFVLTEGRRGGEQRKEKSKAQEDTVNNHKSNRTGSP